MYLLWRDVKGESPHVHLLVGVDAGHDEENAGSTGSAAQKSAKSEDDDSLVLLNDLDSNIGEKRRALFVQWARHNGGMRERETTITLTAKHREKGTVTNTRTMEKKVMRWAQMPGPSSHATK